MGVIRALYNQSVAQINGTRLMINSPKYRICPHKLEKFPQPTCIKRERRGRCVITVMRSETPPIYVRLSKYTYCEKVQKRNGGKKLICNNSKDNEETDFPIVPGSNPEISLNALIGPLSPRTMRLYGKKGNGIAIILEDLRSTHNFLDPSIFIKTNYPRKKL